MTPKTKDKILVVDDEDSVANVLLLFLREAGYDADWAMSGEECLERLAQDTYSLVLLDIRMPQMSGVEVLENVRATNNDVAIIMMSGHGSESIAVTCMKIGADDYIAKPFDLNDALQRVEQGLQHRLTLREKQRLEQEKDDFVSMLSHDMKNPLTAVIGSIDIMREGRLGPVNEEQVEYLQSAIDSCNEVVSMIDNMLDLHRYDAGHLALSLEACDPNVFLVPLASRFGMLAGREDVRFMADIAEDLPEIAVDRAALGRTLGNLCGNALKFTPEGGEVTLRCRTLTRLEAEKLRFSSHVALQAMALLGRHERFVQLSVRDTGDGIPAEDHGRIFERFVQAKHNGKRYGGVGLGLAYCKLTVERFGGIIWVESEPGQGSVFSILLPVFVEKRNGESA